MERGRGAGATLETWAAVAAAVDERLVMYLEHAPGATLPRDHAHLRGQELVIRTARSGGWLPMPEALVDPVAVRSRSIDVLLARGRGEIAVVEVWDWFDDIGAAMRSLEGKVEAVRRQEPHTGRRASGLWIVRATRRNRAMVADLHAMFAAKFPAPSAGWLRAIADPGVAMPAEHGFVWADVRATRLFAARLRR